MGARSKQQIDRMTPEARLKRAREAIEKIVGNTRSAVYQQATNRIVVYSPAIASQVPKSFAANALQQLQRTLFNFQVVRVCSLWDPVDPKKNSLPTVAYLLDHPDVLKELRESTHRKSLSFGVTPPHGIEPDHPDFAAVMRILEAQHLQDAETTADRAVTETKELIVKIRAIDEDHRHTSIRNVRDRAIAHSLEGTQAEEAGPIRPLKFGDETWLLNETIPIVERLYVELCGVNYGFDEVDKIGDRYAKAFWDGVSVKVKE